MEKIFKKSGLCAAVCASLTCTKLYAYFKNCHGDEPLPLTMPIVFARAPRSRPRSMLAHLLVDWSVLGSEYRLTFGHNCRFLSIAAYGRKARGLRELEWDCNNSDYNMSLLESVPPDGHPSCRLPNPFNKGIDWGDEAVQVIQASLDHFGDVEDWIYHWYSYMVWNAYERKLGVFLKEWQTNRTARSGSIFS